MAPKDYYSLLQLKPGAPLSEVKQAYRRLAKRYHPDRNPGDPYAQTRFQEIHEAYGILSDPARRETYDREQGIRPAPGPLSPEDQLALARQLQHHVAGADWGRMDRKALLRELRDLLAPDRLRTLKNDPATSRDVLHCTLQAAGPLEYPLANSLQSAWMELAGTDAVAKKTVAKLLKQKRREFLWKRGSVPVFLVLTGLLCYLMYRWGR